MKILKIVAIAALAGACCSCSWFAKKTPQVPKADAPSLQAPEIPEAARIDALKAEAARSAEAFRKDDISILIKADPQLNRYQNNAHALFLCVYQLKDPNGFNQLAEEDDGLAKLLECGRFDGSVANAKRLVVQPGQELKEMRDRAEGARYLGIASGYYGTGKEKMTHLSPLANVAGKGGTTIRMELGPFEITNVQVK